MGVRGKRFRFAVVTAFPESDWHSVRMLAALSEFGETIAVDPSRLAAWVGGTSLQIDDGQGLACDAFVLARGVSPHGDAEAQFSVYRALETAGALVVNRLDALFDARDKFRTSLLLTASRIATPRAALVQSTEQAIEVVQAFRCAVVKPLSGSLGDGVERLEWGEASLPGRIESRLAKEGALYLQEWVPNEGRDLRVFVVGGRVVGAVERVARPGDFRTNMARGALAQPVQLAEAVEDLARRAAFALDLDYTGVDLIAGPQGPRVIEVNGNPSFDMILHATGKDMAQAIARHVVRRVEGRQAASRCTPRFRAQRIAGR